MFRKKDMIILVTSMDTQAKITEECLKSINSYDYNIGVYLLNYGTNDPDMRKLKKYVDHYHDFAEGTPITEEMNYGIKKGLKEANLIANLNNDVILHNQFIDTMLSLMKEKEIISLSGHIITDKDEIKYYEVKDNHDLYYKNAFLNPCKFKSWLDILSKDFGFDLYSCNTWHKSYFDKVGLPDSKTFNKGIYLWDTDLQYRGALKGIDTYVASSAIYFHEMGYTQKNSNDLSRKTKLYVDMRNAYYKKWGGIQFSSTYKGSQHNEDYIYPFQNTLSTEQIRKKVLNESS